MKIDNMVFSASKRLQADMDAATTYKEWKAAAIAYDKGTDLQRQARHKDLSSCVALHDSDSRLSKTVIAHYLKKNARPSNIGRRHSSRYRRGCTLMPSEVT